MPAIARRLGVVLTSLALCAALTACRSDGTDDDRDPAPEADPTSRGGLFGLPVGPDQPAPPEAPPVARGDVVERLPGRARSTTLRLQAIHDSPTAGYARLDTQDAGGIVFADGVAVVAPPNGFVAAYDLDTGRRLWERQVWRTELRGRAESVICPIPDPPAGATAVAVLFDIDCGRMVSYDLRTGRQVHAEAGFDGVSASGCGVARVGGYTYWCHGRGLLQDDILVRIEPDGTTTRVAGVDLGSQIPEDSFISHLNGGADRDLLVMKTQERFEYNPGSADLDAERYLETTDDGLYLGYRLTATQERTTAETAFRTEAADAVTDAVPQQTVSGARAVTYDGLLLSLMSRRPGGREAPRTRIGLLDPETGRVGDNVVFDPPRGTSPSLYSGYDSLRSTTVRDRTVFSTSLLGDEGNSVSRYDLDEGRGALAWTWRPPRGRYDPPRVSVVGTTPEADSVYVSVHEQFVSSTLVELDATTGQPTRTWTVPDRIVDKFATCELTTDGRYVVAFDSSFSVSGSTSYGEGRRERVPLVAVLEIPGT